MSKEDALEKLGLLLYDVTHPDEWMDTKAIKEETLKQMEKDLVDLVVYIEKDEK